MNFNIHSFEDFKLYLLRIFFCVTRLCYVNNTDNAPIDVTLRRVPVTFVSLQKQEVLHILSVYVQPMLFSM